MRPSQIADTSCLRRKRPESIVCGAGGLCGSYLTGVEKGISACPPPANVAPLLIITAEEVKEREKLEGESRLLLNMLSIKSERGFGWVCRRAGWVSGPRPLYFSLERTPDQMETIQTELAEHQPTVLIKSSDRKSTISPNTATLRQPRRQSRIG